VLLGISKGKLRRGAQGRTGIFQVPPLHTWSEGHSSFKLEISVQTTGTAMPLDRRIAQLFIQNLALKFESNGMSGFLQEQFRNAGRC
jgi:hypothetical protein